MEYVIVLFPIIAVAGLNAPVAALVMPLPLHVPPVSAAVKTTGATSAQ